MEESAYVYQCLRRWECPHLPRSVHKLDKNLPMQTLMQIYFSVGEIFVGDLVLTMESSEKKFCAIIFDLLNELGYPESIQKIHFGESAYIGGNSWKRFISPLAWLCSKAEYIMDSGSVTPGSDPDVPVEENSKAGASMKDTVSETLKQYEEVSAAFNDEVAKCQALALKDGKKSWMRRNLAQQLKTAEAENAAQKLMTKEAQTSILTVKEGIQNTRNKFRTLLQEWDSHEECAKSMLRECKKRKWVKIDPEMNDDCDR